MHRTFGHPFHRIRWPMSGATVARPTGDSALPRRTSSVERAAARPPMLGEPAEKGEAPAATADSTTAVAIPAAGVKPDRAQETRPEPRRPSGIAEASARPTASRSSHRSALDRPGPIGHRPESSRGLHAGAHRINPTGRLQSRLALVRGKGHDQQRSVWPKPATTFVALSAVGPPQTSQRASSEHFARTSFRNDCESPPLIVT